MARHPGGRTCSDIFGVSFWLTLPLYVAYYHITGRNFADRKRAGR